MTLRFLTRERWVLGGEGGGRSRAWEARRAKPFETGKIQHHNTPKSWCVSQMMNCNEIVLLQTTSRFRPSMFKTTCVIKWTPTLLSLAPSLLNKSHDHHTALSNAISQGISFSCYSLSPPRFSASLLCTVPKILVYFPYRTPAVAKTPMKKHMLYHTQVFYFISTQTCWIVSRKRTVSACTSFNHCPDTGHK